MPVYRVRTTRAIPKSLVLAAFAKDLPAGLNVDESNWQCTDGSQILFKAGPSDGLFFVELRCRFHALPKKTVSYGVLPTMIMLCNQSGGTIKVVRNNSVLPANGGIYSDVFRSKANRTTTHLAENPRDRQARRHHKQELAT